MSRINAPQKGGGDLSHATLLPPRRVAKIDADHGPALSVETLVTI
ncbi:MAG: hypothetical protein AAF899_14230 [Pseudomonadota bacterium]